MASFEEALINMYRMYPVLYDMTLKDDKNEKMKLNVCEKIAEQQKNCSMLRVVVLKVWELMNIYIYRLFDS